MAAWSCDGRGECVAVNALARTQLSIQTGELWDNRWTLHDDDLRGLPTHWSDQVSGLACLRTSQESVNQGDFDACASDCFRVHVRRVGPQGPWLFTATPAAQEHVLREQFEQVHRHHVLLGHVLGHMHSGAVITDAQGLVQWVNKGYEAMSGRSLVDLRGRRADWFDPCNSDAELSEETTAAITRATARGEAFEAMLALRASEECPTWANLNVRLVHDDAGKVTHYIGIYADVTDVIRAKQHAQRCEQRYAQAVKGSNDAIFDWDLQSDHVHITEQWGEILAGREAAYQGHVNHWFSQVRSSDLMQLQLDISSHLTGLTDRVINEHQIRHTDGSWRWVACKAKATRDARGEPTRLAGAIRDITDEKLEEQSLRLAADRDALTGLHNRKSLLKEVTLRIKHSDPAESQSFALVFLDFDRFKLVNDGLGHAAGDLLLQSIGKRLQDHLREDDIAARLGGDEFVLILQNIDHADEASAIVERTIHSLAAPHHLHGRRVTVTASAGVVLYNHHYKTADEMLRDADTAMYEAKNRGKATHVMFDAEMHAQAYRRLTLEHEIRNALDAEQFEVYYQPIVRLDSGDVCGVEALLRWNHPTLGNISPAEFIPVAEETALIVPIGQWVLEQSVKWVLDTNRTRNTPLKVHVNLSKKQLMQPEIIDVIRDLLQTTGLDPALLDLEVTETAVVGEQGGLADRLAELRDLGCRLSMDDFGTGQSSLSCLHEYPITTLKIDRSFISNMDIRSEFVAVVQAILTLARTLDVEVVAEGVETPGQMARLQALGCDHAQGYFFAKPMQGQDAKQFLIDLDVAETSAQAA